MSPLVPGFENRWLPPWIQFGGFTDLSTYKNHAFRLWDVISAGEICKILFPFHGEQMFLFIIAVFTSRSNVVLSTLAAANDWNDVIHGQLIWRKTPSAVIAGASGQSLLPPPRFTKSPGLFPLSLYLLFTYRNYKR